MNWFIDDYDQTQIYITDLWREFYVPKFRIAMSVEEPYLFLYWNDRERGEGGDERLLQIDYQDVVDGYGGYVDNPSSATELMATINEMILSGFGGTGGGDVSYPIPVDGVTITGGTGIGDPLVAVGSASSVTQLTPELFADGNITGIGSNQFLDDLGYTDGTAAIAWPLTAANYPGGLTAADFTLDTVCWQEMFYYAKANGAAYMTTSIDYATDDVSKSYYVNKTLYLPRIKDVASNINSLSFIIDFKGTRVRNSSGGDMILFDRYPDDQDDADTLISYQYCFLNGVLRGDGGVTDDDTLIRLGSTSRSEFRNMNFEHAGVIVDLQFCLEPVFDNINISDYGEYGLMIWNGQWTGAGFFNSQSNIPSISHFRSYNSPGNTPVATIYCNGNHTISGDVWTFEGDVGCEHHFFYDNDGSAGVNLGSISKIYMEFAGCTRAAIRVRAGKGQFIIRDFRSSIDETDMPVLIEGDNDRDPTSSIHMFIEKSAYGTIDSKFRAVGDPDYPVVWCVEDVRMNDNTQLNVAANFETGVIANSYVPDDDHVRFISTDARGSVVWVDGVTITGQGTEADPFVTGTQMSITSDASGIKLSGDSSSPGNLKLYGTNSSGTKGWYAQSAFILGYTGNVNSTNTTGEEALWNLLIPAGTTGAGDVIRITWGIDKTSGSSTWTTRVRLHTATGTGGTAYTTFAYTGTVKQLVQTVIHNSGASAQIGSPATALAGYGQFGVAYSTSALNTANDIWINLTSQKVTGTDAAALVWGFVEILKYRP